MCVCVGKKTPETKNKSALQGFTSYFHFKEYFIIRVRISVAVVINLAKSLPLPFHLYFVHLIRFLPFVSVSHLLLVTFFCTR